METIVDIGNCVVISEEVGNCTFKQGLKKRKLFQLGTYLHTNVSKQTCKTSFQKQIDRINISVKYIQVCFEKKTPIHILGDAFSKN